MSGPAVPPPKLPQLTLPNIRSIPAIPHVGCAGADGTSYIGQQFGNLPDLHTVLAIKNLKKALEEQIYALIKGQLPDLTRPPVYAARAAQLTNELAEIVAALNQVIGGATAEIEGNINFVNARIGAVNTAKTAIEGIPPAARNAVQRLLLQEYTACLGQLNAQVGRLQSAIACLSG